MAFENKYNAGGVGSTVEVSEIESLASNTFIVGDGVGAPTTTAAAAASDLNTGTDATKPVTADALAGSNIGTKTMEVVVFDSTTDITTGDGKAYLTIPANMAGMDLIRAQATVVTAGTTNATTIMIHNLTDAVDMLSGAISIASAGVAGTVGTIDATKDDVTTNDRLRIDVDSVSTTAPKGLTVILEFRLP